MKNVLIVCGHPDFKNSVANKTIVEEISALCPQAEIRKVDELFVNGSFDVKAEQAAFEKADVILFQYPMHWYGLPGLFKLYIDKVMEHGWAYGSKGTALTGKALIASLTMGAPDSAYAVGGVMGHTVEEFSYQIKNFAALCKLDFKKLFSLGGMMCVPGVTTDAQKAALIDKAKKQAADIVDCIKSL